MSMAYASFRSDEAADEARRVGIADYGKFGNDRHELVGYPL